MIIVAVVVSSSAAYSFAIGIPFFFFGHVSKGSTTTTNSTTFASPMEVCSNLPKTALGIASSNPNSSTAFFLIVEADLGTTYTGINGSYFHQDSNWPVMTVYQGQQVTVHVINCPQSPEPHGFAIGHYFNMGVALSPGQTDTIRFVASTTGRFTVYCNIFCAIHQYMQNGELLVEPMPSS